MQQSLFEIAQGTNILPFHGEALFYPGFFTEKESLFYFRMLLNEYEYRQVPVRIYDKEVLQPKLTALTGEAGEDLEYSSNILPVQPWTENLLTLKAKVEETAGIRFTQALLNLYRDGKDGVGWHRDKEKPWGLDPVIASLSLGAARTFQMRYKENKQIIKSVELTPGSLIIMKGLSQRCWEHRIPKTNKRIGPRLNITFRVMEK
ncbi:MAG TPA: alpha-ketoglutarate-dependent dioxygenase AlkB [Bacteroidales bacterium]|nr:alpha-ketoglutarate-dependent dioxygenase AlkB [Bacteroidales bacterium]